MTNHEIGRRSGGEGLEEHCQRLAQSATASVKLIQTLKEAKK
jgi:hypothetical protein